MRQMLVLLTALMLISVGLHAQMFRPTSVGLFADAEHTVMSVNGPGQFSLYVWWFPGDGGLDWVRFMLIAPQNTQLMGRALGSAFIPGFGCYVRCPLGICAGAQICQFGWVWSDRVEYLLLDSAPGFIEIAHCPDEPVLQVNTCYPGHSKESVIILNKFGLNQGPLIAVAPSSWGAIKSFYR